MKIQVVRDDTIEHHHDVVKRGLNTFVEVGRSLRIIKEESLFQDMGYSTFVEYCASEHDIGKSHAYRLVKAAEIAVDHDVKNENVARALADVPQESRAEVLEVAMERMGSNVTGSMIDDVAEEVVQKPAMTQEDQLDICRGDFTGVMQEFVRLGMMLKDLAELEHARHLPVQRVQAALKQAYQDVRWSMPSHVCYACKGRGCELCKGTGFITDAIWNNRPEEID